MLQQTTVATVAGRFDRFLAAFPDVHCLAQADEQKVLRAWEGLGYYNRARNLHRAARKLVDEHRGRIPADAAAFGELPGVGRYIMGAVLSQAFERRLPIVEANTTRVLCRLFGKNSDPKSASMRIWLWQAAASILPAKRVGEFNQALMELGALVCKRRAPECRQCPLRSDCMAFKNGIQEMIPPRTPRPAPTPVRETCLLVRHGRRVLLARRPSGGRCSNMWEFPSVVLRNAESSISGARRIIASLGLDARPGDAIATIRYAVTRFRMTMKCVETTCRVARIQSDYYEEWSWLLPDELADYALSSPQRKLAAILQASPARRHLASR